MIFLDTSAVIDLTNGDKRLAAVVRSAEQHGQPIAIASVSLFELLTPIFHKNLSKKERIIESFLHNVQVLQLDSQASEAGARIMAALLKIGKPVNVLDVLIAGIALTNNVDELVTSDSDFDEIAKVSNLRINIMRAS